MFGLLSTAREAICKERNERIRSKLKRFKKDIFALGEDSSGKDAERG
jgi:hypothetical protein